MEMPAISVIIPLYNMEKYVGECLDSILAQTFQNFEVIVVDDSSTDNSAAIVENYHEKFGGRLILIKFQTNSGNAGYTARNKGFYFSRGEYVFFVDPDDFITKNALEILYTSAKKYDADVVYTGSRYRYTSKDGEKLTIDVVGRNLKKKGVKDKTTLTIDDPEKFLKILLNPKRGIYHTPWTKFVKRDFLTENGIIFYETISGGDYIWTIEIFACAKRFLRIPNAVYFWRDDSADSMTRAKSSIEVQIRKWTKIFLSWVKAMSSMASINEILKKNSEYTYSALIFWMEFCLQHFGEERLNMDSRAVYDILRSEFADKNSKEDLLLPFLFSFIDSQQRELEQLAKYKKSAVKHKKRVAELENEIKKLKAKE